MSRIPASAVPKAGAPAFACPDWCKLPSPAGPVPVPYPNSASLAPSTSNSAKVNLLQVKGLSKAGATDAVEGKTVTNTVDKAVLRGMKSQVPMSTGDEAGAAGGVASATGSKPFGASKVNFAPASNKVVGAGAGAGAAMGGFAAPSQAKIMVAP